MRTGEMLNTLIHHCEAVLHLRFQDGIMITCSKDRSIAVWDLNSATDITLRRVLVGHRAAVNVVDFDDKFIVSASGDRSIKVREQLMIFSGLQNRHHQFRTYAKFSEKNNISYPLIRTRICACQGVKNVSFSENFAYALNG